MHIATDILTLSIKQKVTNLLGKQDAALSRRIGKLAPADFSQICRKKMLSLSINLIIVQKCNICNATKDIL